MSQGDFPGSTVATIDPRHQAKESYDALQLGHATPQSQTSRYTFPSASQQATRDIIHQTQCLASHASR